MICVGIHLGGRLRRGAVHWLPVLLVFALAACTCGQNRASQQSVSIDRNTPDARVLSPEQWKRVDHAVERALGWLAAQQNRDGSFPSIRVGQPGATGLCALAFLSQGHLPDSQQYGATVRRAVDYIASCQRRNGMIALAAPNSSSLSRSVTHSIGFPVCYSHGIGGLVLSETYGMDSAERAEAIEPVITKALEATLAMQRWPKPRSVDDGGWRYLDEYEGIDSDLSITGWQLMFLRSAKNAGFDVPQEPIDNAIGYVKRCFREREKTFAYKISGGNWTSRAMAGAGILALAHAGLHNTREAQLAGDWLLRSRFDRYNMPGNIRTGNPDGDRYHYGLLTCCQAMYQLGGRHWEEFFPQVVPVILSGQNADGSWQRENHGGDRRFGNAYTTGICVIALGAPNQLLPIFQR